MVADRRRAAVERSSTGATPLTAAPRTAAPSPAGTGPAPSATAPEGSPEPSPLSGVRDSAATAVSYVDDVTEGRSTGLLIAVAGGMIALLVLIAREWLR